MKGFEDGDDMFKFAHPHQDPGSAILYVLGLLDALSRDPDEDCLVHMSYIVCLNGDCSLCTSGLNSILSLLTEDKSVVFT